MQCKNYVRDRKAGTSHSWDETLQPTHPWNQWEQMDRFRLTQNQHRRDSAIFWKRRWRAPWGSSHHPQERSREVPDGVESNQQQAQKSEIERETHQHNYHPMLRTKKRQWGRQQGHLLRTASSRTGEHTTFTRWRLCWEISMQRLEMTTGTAKGPWGEKNVAPWMTMERDYWKPAPPMNLSSEGRFFHTETSTSWPGTPPMEETRTILTTWWSTGCVGNHCQTSEWEDELLWEVTITLWPLHWSWS